MTREFASPISSKIRRQTFQPSCPAGGEFYACDYGWRFVGCCTSEPCNDGCEDSSLKPSSFLEEKYADVPGALCPGGSHWYKCAGTTPPFMGCCSSDPCKQDGCPAKDLRAATLASDPPEALPYSPIPNPSLAQSTKTSRVPSTSLSTRSHSSVGIPTSNVTGIRSGPVSSYSKTSIFTVGSFSSLDLPTATGTPPASALTSSSSKMRIIGGTIGGVVGGAVTVIAIGILFILYRRRKASKRRSFAPVNSDSPSLPNMDMFSPISPREVEADSRLLVPQIDGSPLVQIDGSPLSQLDGSPLSQLDGSPISELAPSPPPRRPIFEFPA